MSRTTRSRTPRAPSAPEVVHTWPPEGIPEGMSYLETISLVDGAPVRIAVPEDPDGEVEAVSAAFDDPEILRHVGTRESDSEDGPPLPLEQVYTELGLTPPERRYSGTFRVRLPKDLHRTLSAQAEQQGVSLNTLIVSYLSDRAARREAVREAGR